MPAWIIASAGFFFYVSEFATYSATYGAFATVVILLIWLWLTNVVLLFGAELNAVVDLRRDPTGRQTTTVRCCRPRTRRRPDGARRSGGLCRETLPLTPFVR